MPKRPVLATIIAIFLLIPTPFLILNSLNFFRNPSHKVILFDHISKAISIIILQKVPEHTEAEEFVNILFRNLKAEYSQRMDNPNSSMRKIETYKVSLEFIIAIATIFICIGLLRLKKEARKFMMIRLIASLILITPLSYLSARHMGEVVLSSVNRSLYELPQFEGSEGKIEITKTIAQKKIQEQNRMPLIINIIWNILLLGYFLHPNVRRAFSKDKNGQTS